MNSWPLLKLRFLAIAETTWLSVSVVCLLGFVLPVRADETVDYVGRVKPVLRERCYACHGVLKQEAGLRLDTAEFAIKGGDSGSAIKPGDIAASPLLERVASHDDALRMPPEGEPLKPEEIAALRSWIATGASSPSDEAPERDPRDHWAFQKPKRPQVPQVDWGLSSGVGSGQKKKNEDPSPRHSPQGRGEEQDEPIRERSLSDHHSRVNQNPIDSFIAAAHQSRGLRPQPAADKRVWLRRVSLDLVGLPPTLEEMDAFLADDSVEAFDTVVTRLLDSPHYGERWGRHWMDIWRYSDWWGLGEDARNSQKHIWHWRDWIVESLNADKGYDQMLREMLAADELYPDDFDKLRAGGFLSRQYFKFNRTSWMDETVEHTSKAMLGLTFNCAKCHDHKYDPFSQADYYRFRAIFEPYQVRLDAVGGQIDFEKDGIPRPFDCNLDAKTYLHIRGDDRNPDTSREMEPAMPQLLALASPTVEAVLLPPFAIQPGLRPQIVDAYLKQAEQRIVEKRTELDAAKKRLSEAEQREALAVSVPRESQAPATGGTVVSDHFSVAKPETWEILDGQWTYADGKLIQSHDGPIRGVMRLRERPPVDFEATLKFVPTGGQVWKSVGITFDGTDSNEVLAYLSAYADGPKAQVAYKKGDYVYPGEAAKARPILLNTVYELRLRVRGTLVNVAVNGEHAVAYRLPLERQQGPLQIITYDAKAEFQSFELSPLSPTAMLTEAATGNRSAETVLTVEQSKLAVAIAERELTLAMLQPDSIRSRAIADEARYHQPPAAMSAELSRAAAKAERGVAAAKAELDVARAELDVSRAPADKKAELESKFTAARTALENAVKAVNEVSETFTSLHGASKALESNLETEESRLKPFPTTSTGRRTALAKWMTDRNNPLTARVAVNHLWARHFGRPLVPTVFDFGRKGTAPTHPDLLDWLALELMEGSRPEGTAATVPAQQGWGMKHIHRLIVTSNTYRMTSSSANAPSENLAHDSDNHFYWRMNPTRMQSQIVRDSLLSIAGELDLTMAGPSIPTSNESSRRRSLYFVHSNIDHQKFLSMFDDASVLDCYRRAESIVPQQALALENSPLATLAAEKITQRILAGNSEVSETDFVRQVFLTVLCVEPSESEMSEVTTAMKQMTEAAQRASRSDPVMHAKVNLVQALLNHNDFVTVR